MFEIPTKKSNLDSLQKSIISEFAGENLSQKILKELSPFSPVGLISIDSDNFECRFQIPSPYISVIKKNEKMFLVGQATAKTTEMILLVKDKKSGKIEIYRSLTQNSMLYIHKGQSEETVSQVYWNDSKDGQFEICLDDLPIGLKEISVRNTLFASLTLADDRIIDCRETNGIIGQKSENIGQRSPFSNIINLANLVI